MQKFILILLHTYIHKNKLIYTIFQVINLYFEIHTYNTQKQTYIYTTFQVINLYLHNLYTMTFIVINVYLQWYWYTTFQFIHNIQVINLYFEIHIYNKQKQTYIHDISNYKLILT